MLTGRAFADEVGATDCADAVRTRHEQITGRGYGNSTATDVSYGPKLREPPPDVDRVGGRSAAR